MRMSPQIYTGRFEFLKNFCKSGNILDIGNLGGIDGQGPSNSFHTQFIQWAHDSTVYGLDRVEPSAIQKDSFKKQTTCNLEEGIPLEPRFFDTVYLGQVLEHLQKPVSALTEISRVLKDQGVLILDVPNPYSLSRLIKYVFFKKEDLGDKTHICFYTPASLERILAVAGFVIIEMATDWKEKFSFLPKKVRIGLGSHLLVACHKKI
jgi:SAM-dependent methyltransferase